MAKWFYDTLSDQKLMRLYARGRQQAFESLYRRHRIGLYQFLRRQCGSDAVAEELAQDAWMAVIRRASNYRPTAKFKTWLYRIAHNRLVDHWRKFGPTANVVTEELTDVLASADRCSHGARVAELMALVEALPKAQMTTMLLKLSGFTRKEIAQITEVNQETVKSRLRYAKRQLTQLLGSGA